MMTLLSRAQSCSSPLAVLCWPTLCKTKTPFIHSTSLNVVLVSWLLCFSLCRMALTLHQSGHGHSHGGLSSHGHSHDHGKEKGHGHANGNHCDVEGQGGKKQLANASVRAAFVHVIGDLLQSISVLVSALIIFFKVRNEGTKPVLFNLMVKVVKYIRHKFNRKF